MGDPLRRPNLELLKLEEKSLKAKKALKRLKPMKSNAARSVTDSLRRC